MILELVSVAPPTRNSTHKQQAQQAQPIGLPIERYTGRVGIPTRRLFLKGRSGPHAMRSSVLLVWALSISLNFVACAAKRSRSVKNKRQMNQRFFEIRRSCENNTPSVDAAAAAAEAATMNHRQADPSTGQLQSGRPMQQQPKQQPDGCAHLIFEESAGCITACISPECHDKIYANPLEVGEIDLIRHAQFELCAKRALKERQRIERIEKRKASSAGYM